MEYPPPLWFWGRSAFVPGSRILCATPHTTRSMPDCPLTAPAQVHITLEKGSRQSGSVTSGKWLALSVWSDAIGLVAARDGWGRKAEHRTSSRPSHGRPQLLSFASVIFRAAVRFGGHLTTQLQLRIGICRLFSSSQQLHEYIHV